MIVRRSGIVCVWACVAAAVRRALAGMVSHFRFVWLVVVVVVSVLVGVVCLRLCVSEFVSIAVFFSRSSPSVC